MKVLQTKKLFFGKWLYKIETSTPGASLIKHWGVRNSKDYCTNPKDNRWRRHYNPADKALLLEYISAVEPFLDQNLQMRAEWDTLNFYVNDQDLYLNLKTALSKWVAGVTEPASVEDAESLKEKGCPVLCNELPYNKFQYRIYLRYQMPAYIRLKFLAWLENYDDSIRPSKGTVKWLSSGNPYFQDPFIYVSDHNLLLMAKLFLGSYARKTEEFVLRNTGK